MYSQSYRVPLLYFFLHSLPARTSTSIDSVYDLLVPQHLKANLKSVGVLGGIGIVVSDTVTLCTFHRVASLNTKKTNASICGKNHPFFDLPCFWVHPCNTAEAIGNHIQALGREVNPLEYFSIWLGVVGVVVGLSLPKGAVTGSVSLQRQQLAKVRH